MRNKEENYLQSKAHLGNAGSSRNDKLISLVSQFFCKTSMRSNGDQMHVNIHFSDVSLTKKTPVISYVRSQYQVLLLRFLYIIRYVCMSNLIRIHTIHLSIGDKYCIANVNCLIACISTKCKYISAQLFSI